MMNALRTLAATAALIAASALPAAAAATHAAVPLPGTTVFNTKLTPDWYGVGEYDGTLTLTVDADGIVNGYYRAADGNRLTYVTGGLDGNHLWLDLGQDGLSHIDGTFDGRTIAGGTFLAGQNYTFLATPRP
jgi:hypothetical protein